MKKKIKLKEESFFFFNFFFTKMCYFNLFCFLMQHDIKNILKINYFYIKNSNKNDYKLKKVI